MTSRKHKSDLVILFTTLGLMGLGLIVIYAIGPMRANVLNSTYGTNYGSSDYFIGQLRSVAPAPERLSCICLRLFHRTTPLSSTVASSVFLGLQSHSVQIPQKTSQADPDCGASFVYFALGIIFGALITGKV